MAKIGNELKFLLFVVNLSKPNKLVNGFAVAAESHAATRLPAFAPQNCLSHSLPRSATGHIQTRWAQDIRKFRMAVWMQIIGIRKLHSVDDEKERISIILDNFKIEFDQFNWTVSHNNEIEFFEITVFEHTLKVFFDNPNFIEFSGNEYFSSWFKFANRKHSKTTDRFREIFRQFSSRYGILELIYFSEWFFELNEIRNKMETFQDLLERIKKYPDHEKKELEGIKSNEFYIERISPVPNTV